MDAWTTDDVQFVLDALARIVDMVQVVAWVLIALFGYMLYRALVKGRMKL